MKTGDAHGLLNGHLKKMTAIPPIAWEHDTFKQPADGKAYMRVAFMPADSAHGSLGENGTTHERGVYQVGISAPSGKGTGDVEDLADKIIAHFKNKRLGDSGALRTLLPKRSQAMPDEGRIWLAVSIPYFYETF